MKKYQGYTIIEVLVTVIAGAIFLIAFIRLAGGATNLSIRAAQRIAAENLAYNNLRQYANSSPARSIYPCSTTNPQPTVTLTSSTGSAPNLPGSVTQEVKADAPYGCPGTILFTSSVTYGPNAQKVVYATYAEF